MTQLLLPKPRPGAIWNRDCQSLSCWHDRLWVQASAGKDALTARAVAVSAVASVAVQSRLQGLSTGAEKVQKPTLVDEHYAKPRHFWAYWTFDRRGNIAISVSVAVVWLRLVGVPRCFFLIHFSHVSHADRKARPGEALSAMADGIHRSRSGLLFDFCTAQRISACRFFLSSNLRPRFATLKLGGERSRIHADDHHSISSTCIRQPPASRALICMFP
jgi:hypothetical protein